MRVKLLAPRRLSVLLHWRGPLLVVGLATGSPVQGIAQEATPPSRASGIPRWATVSFGFGTPSSTALLLGVSLQTKPALLSLRVTANIARDNGPTESDLALLALHATSGRHLRAALGGGIALVAVDDGTRGYFHPINRRTTMGLPLQIQGLWCFDRSVGLGLTGFANLNTRRSFGGITLGIVWGVFWPPRTSTGG